MSAPEGAAAVPKLDTGKAMLPESGSSAKAGERGLKESNENAKPSQAELNEAKATKPRRASESGIPAGRTTPRRLSSGTGQVTTPRAKITPRETRSSTLRKSTSGVDSSSLRSAGSLGSPNAAGFELTRLRDDLQAKQKEADKLGEVVATLKGSLSSKERALSKVSAEHDGLRSRLLQAEGTLTSRLKELRDVEAERNRLRSANQDLERLADRLDRKLNAQPKGTGFSEAVATLEAEVKSLKHDNTRLTDDAKGAHNQVRAKDKQLDTMALEVDEARRIVIQNGELENYILDLRRQLNEAAAERATLVHVQRQNRAELAVMTEQRDDAHAEAERVGRELSLCKTDLKASEENAATLGRELELRRAELTRVGAVASRALHREASSIKEDGTVPFNQHKEEVMHLKGEIMRLKEKLRLEEKSAAATQQQMRQLFARVDALQGKSKQASPRASPRNAQPESKPSPRGAASARLTTNGSASAAQPIAAEADGTEPHAAPAAANDESAAEISTEVAVA